MTLTQSEIDALLDSTVWGPGTDAYHQGRDGGADGGLEGCEDLATILAIKVPVIVELARRSLKVREIININLGSIVEFSQDADSELDMLVNNQVIGRGTAVKVGEHFGIKINSISSVDNRINAMGG
jgi:flagellar motor switch protein FliN/FliY